MAEVPRYLFVLGAGRSGTKIFRDCLGAADSVSAVPYDVGYVWRYGNERTPHDELLPKDANRRTAKFVDRTLRSMAKKAARGAAFDLVVEKSVPNVLRPAFVAEMFPNARFVRIVRDGHAVISSALRNWQDPADRGYFLDKLRYFPIQNYHYGVWSSFNRLRRVMNRTSPALWGPRYEGIESDVRRLPLVDVCAHQWARCVERCEEQLDALTSERVLRVRYEDLVQDETVLRDVCAFARIEDVDSVLEFYRARFDQSLATASASELTADEVARVAAIAGRAMQRFGYV